MRLVFPAYAGMFRSCTRAPTHACGFPRIRGDVPATTKSDIPFLAFSPHTRGCSAIALLIIPQDQVFPAYAGMFRNASSA